MICRKVWISPKFGFVILCIAYAYGYRFKAADGLCHLHEDLLCRFCSQSPVIRSLRPDSPAALMWFKFSRHPKAILFWGRCICFHVKYLPLILFSMGPARSPGPLLLRFCRVLHPGRSSGLCHFTFSGCQHFSYANEHNGTNGNRQYFI